MIDSQLLLYDDVTHEAWTRGINEADENSPLGCGCVKYFRFYRQVNIDYIKVLPKIRTLGLEYGYYYPKHLIIQTYDYEHTEWHNIKECNMERGNNGEPQIVSLNIDFVDNIRIICDEKHPLEVSILSDFWKENTIIPYSLLDNLEIYGQYRQEELYLQIVNPRLERVIGNITPPKNMEITCQPHLVTYKSKNFKVAFSLIRPMIMHLSWDDTGKGNCEQNLIREKSVHFFSRPNKVHKGMPGRFCGPSYYLLKNNLDPYFWTGEVIVEGSKVHYRNLHSIDEVSLDISFEVHEYGMDMKIIKHCSKDVTAIEADDFRFIWDIEQCVTGTLGLPDGNNGRTGIVPLPALWNAPGHGTLCIRTDERSDFTTMQVDGYREKLISCAGICVGCKRDKYGYIKIKKGTYKSYISFKTEALRPAICTSDSEVPAAIFRNWTASLGFRPEGAGFSNNSIGVNCHTNQIHIAEIAQYTDTIKGVPSVADLLQYTIEIALKGGPGYGGVTDVAMDSDPCLLISVGKIYQIKKNTDWIKKNWYFIKKACLRMIGNVGESGLLECSKYSGNSGTGKWSCNGWDVVSFGHIDAYSNEQAYRALRNVSVLARIVNDRSFSEACDNVSASIKRNYQEYLYNPQTGWLGGWKSRDGVLHDYGFTFINYIALCYGLVDENISMQIMKKLEEQMDLMGLDYYYYGIPCNLFPVKRYDVPEEFSNIRPDGLDAYGLYINGSLIHNWMGYYIRALSKYGYKTKADLVCSHLEEHYKDSRHIKSIESQGNEFFTWEGHPCGYEGVFVSDSILAFVARHRNIVETVEPEWWIE